MMNMSFEDFLDIQEAISIKEYVKSRQGEKMQEQIAAKRKV